MILAGNYFYPSIIFPQFENKKMGTKIKYIPTYITSKQKSLKTSSLILSLIRVVFLCLFIYFHFDTIFFYSIKSEFIYSYLDCFWNFFLTFLILIFSVPFSFNKSRDEE